MAMDILAYTFGVIALAAAIKCFVDENWGEKCTMNQRYTAFQMQRICQDNKAA